MKKFVIGISVLIIIVFVFIKLLSKPSYFEIASEAELQGKYDIALENYVKAISEITEAMTYPDKSKAATQTNEEWIQEVERYISWMAFSIPQDNNEFSMAIEGMKRCMPFIDSVNFITDEKIKILVEDSLAKEWQEDFIRINRDESKDHRKLISRVMADSMSILRISAMTGYIYTLKLLDLTTGKRVDFILYPNSAISLLVKTRDYFLICSSEVQFTEGLSGKTWYSPVNLIPIKAPDRTSLYSMILRTRVHRTK